MYEKINTAILVDQSHTTKWQEASLKHSSNLLNIVKIYSNNKPAYKRNIFRYTLYYIISLFNVRGRQTRLRSVKEFLPSVEVTDFDCVCSSSGWQSLPDHIYDDIESSEITLLIKFGLGLMTVDHSRMVDVISFHHGDPSSYRGRPAGFYEILNDEKKMGCAVQIITNKLDAGELLYIGHSKVYRRSYRRTCNSFYALSKYVLRRALISYQASLRIPYKPSSSLYKLPGNLLCLKFIHILMMETAQYYFSKIFYYRKWMARLVKYNGPALDSLDLLSGGSIPFDEDRYCGIADPFFAPKGDLIYYEGIRKHSGLGEISSTDLKNPSKSQPVLQGNSKNFSYPFSMEHGESILVLPEIASFSSPRLYSEPDFENYVSLKGLEDVLAIDGTMFHHEDLYYYFCNNQRESPECLFLYCSPDLYSKFYPHRMNPIVIDSEFSRMGALSSQTQVVKYTEFLKSIGVNTERVSRFTI